MHGSIVGSERYDHNHNPIWNQIKSRVTLWSDDPAQFPNFRQNRILQSHLTTRIDTVMPTIKHAYIHT